MKKTLLLCFIHGFKGGDDTFANFPPHLKAILQHALPNVKILSITYPKYETRGDLHECVARFKEWLQNKVIDLEVANNTPSPTVDPSVHTVLIGHSMGGIVAAETLLSIVSEQPINPIGVSRSPSTSSLLETSSLMFPYVQGILAFDTPYLGIAPGVVAHGAEKHWNTASSAYSAYTNVASAFGWGAKTSEAGPVDASKMITASRTATATAVNDANADAASTPIWQKYGRMALFAGAAGAVAAGGAAAYMKKDQISEGWNWATSHLEFVGSLARPEEMKKRINNIVKLADSHDIGFSNIYTTLGHAVNAQNAKASWAGQVVGTDRTFCNLPKGELKQYFVPAVNDKSTAETWAHMGMFEPKNNPGYYSMSEHAKEILTSWCENEWYEDSDGPVKSFGIDEEEVIVVAEEAEEEFEDVKTSTKEDFENVRKPATGAGADENPWRDES